MLTPRTPLSTRACLVSLLAGGMLLLASQDASAGRWTTDLVSAPVQNVTSAQAPTPRPDIKEDGSNRTDSTGRNAALITEARTLSKNPPSSLVGQSDLGCMAVAIYHEARNQPILGQQAVASVILRRSKARHRWGDTICEVIRPVQFSFMKTRTSFPPITEIKAWRVAVTVAIRTLIAGPSPRFQEADHYHAAHVSPPWRRKMDRIGQFGDHIFYRDPTTIAQK